MAGWIKLDRQITDHWLWKDSPFTKGQAWVDLLLKANHSDNKITIKGCIIELRAGQQARSELTLSKDWGWSRGKVRRFLKMLESDSMIVQHTNHLTSVISICNYGVFQRGDTSVDTANGTTPDTPLGTTGEQQAVHSKECNKDKNGKNVKKKDLSANADVLAVFDYWASVMGKNKSSKLTAKRKSVITARLKDGYTIEQIKQAIDGCARSDYHMGRNDTGTKYDDIELICRTGEKLEHFGNNIGVAIPIRSGQQNSAEKIQAQGERLAAMMGQPVNHGFQQEREVGAVVEGEYLQLEQQGFNQ